MQMSSHSRFKIEDVNAKSLKENNYSQRDYLDLKTTLNSRSDFRKLKPEKSYKTSKLFAATGGLEKLRRDKKGIEEEYELDSSLSDIFNKYDI